MKKMINTYNESDLHEKLKEIYALEFNGKTEQKIEGSKAIADVLLENGDVIEIQTGNISVLKNKIQFLLKNNKKVKIVHPIIIDKFIEMYDENETLLYRKKSPKKETSYSFIKKITGIYDLLLDKNFEIELLFIKSTEKRQKTKNPVQLANKSRRHLKNWIPLGKTLDAIERKAKFSSKNDYLSLIPKSVSTNFTIKELQQSIFNKDFEYDLPISAKKQASNSARILIWLLMKMNFIKENGKRSREKLYTYI